MAKVAPLEAIKSLSPINSKSYPFPHHPHPPEGKAFNFQMTNSKQGKYWTLLDKQMYTIIYIQRFEGEVLDGREKRAVRLWKWVVDTFDIIDW